MGYREEYEAKARKIRAEVDELMRTTPEAELKQRFLKNFGCINFESEEFYHELNLAREFHHRLEAAHPDEHDTHTYDRWTCYHVTECKCGFSEACDSSD